MKFKIHCVLLIVVAAAIAGLSCANAETLPEVIEAAKKYDAAYRAAVAQHGAILTKRSQARAELLPRLTGNANANWNDMRTSYEDDVQPSYTRTFNTGGYSIQLVQPIFQMGSFANYSQFRYLSIQSTAQVAQAENELILRAAQAYYDLLLAKDTREHIAAQKTAIKEQLAAAEKGYTVGASSKIDILESRAKYELIRAQEIEAENDIENKRKALRTIAGPNIGDPHPVTISPRLEKSEDLDFLLAKLEGNFTIQAARAGLDVAEKEISKSRAGYYPSLDAVASYSDTWQGPDANDPNSVNIRTKNTLAGVQLQVPIFNGGGTWAKVNESKKLRDKAKEDLENARRQIGLQISQAYSGVVSGVAQISALEAGVASSELALASNNKGYRAGMRSNVDVLNAQQQLYSAMTDLNKARYNAWMQHLKLQLLVGSVRIPDPMRSTDPETSETPKQISKSFKVPPGVIID